MLLSWSTNTTSIEYAIYSQSQLSPLSNTNGNHITYSRVTESRLDGSKTIYSYTNHDEFPDQVPMDVQTGMKDVLMSAFTSRELERGLLKNIQVYNKSNIVKNIDYNYNDNADRYNDYVKTINQYVLDLNDLLFRYSANKIYTFYPYLKSKVETDYSDDGSTISKTYNYTYNNYNLQSSVTESRSKSNADYKYTTTYPSDINTSPYTLMASNFMLNYPIEQIKYLGTNIVSGKLTTYKAIPTTSNTLFKPDNEYSVKATLPLSSINLFDGTNKDSHYGLPDISFLNYDKVGNLLEIQNKAGFHTTYLWSYNYQYPIAEIKNATYAQVTTALQGITPDQLATSSTPDISTINALRQTLPNTMITNYKYLPFIGTSAIINPRGVTAKYIYDTFNRLYLTQNDDKNILAKNSYGYQNAPDNGQGGYDILSASIQRGANTYEVGTTGSATVTVTGGTGDYTYSWYLINSSGTIVSSSLNGSSAAFNFTPSSAGNLTVRCVVTDNSLGISATVNTTVTYIVSCTFTMKSKYSDLVNNLTLYGSFVTFKLSFTPFANMSLRVNYLVATVCPSCRPSTTQTITCTADGRTWKIYIYSTGEVYWYLSSGSVATAGSTVTVTNLSYNM